MLIPIRAFILIATTLYQTISCWWEDRSLPPGQRFDVGGYALHLYLMEKRGDSAEPEQQNGTETRHPTIVLDHSLGGVEGYLLIEPLAKLARVCIYDRAGYGWSDPSPHPRTSQQIVTELDRLLQQAQIEPPYLLIGDSFGSYNVRLYAHHFPEKVCGIILTDALHETEMLKMPLSLQALKLFFVSGFVMSTLGASLGIVRLLCNVGCFELLKHELKQFPRHSLRQVQRSFCRPKHWITMSREMLNLENSARQLQATQLFEQMPIVSIKASSFFKPSIWTHLIPLQAANHLREKMHQALCQLSTECVQLSAEKSGHFVWVDQPEVMVDAVTHILQSLGKHPSI